MNLSWTENAWDDYWQLKDKRNLKRVNKLLKDIMRSSYEGLGSPEALRHELSGFWSRRITQEHRLVYQIDTQCIYIVQCKGHY